MVFFMKFFNNLNSEFRLARNHLNKKTHQLHVSKRRHFSTSRFFLKNSSTEECAKCDNQFAQYFAITVTGTSGLGLTCLCLYASRLSHQCNYTLWPYYVAERIRATYSYCMGSLSTSLLAALFLMCDRKTLKILISGGPIMYTIYCGLAMMIGVILQESDYENSFYSKHALHVFHAMYLGYFITAVCYAMGPVMLRAALAYVGMVGGLCALGISAPNEEFLLNSAPYAMLLGATATTACFRPFLPPLTWAGVTPFSMAVLVMLCSSAAFILHDTRRVICEAKTLPVTRKDTALGSAATSYDPINSSLQIYSDVVSISRRVWRIIINHLQPIRDLSTPYVEQAKTISNVSFDQISEQAEGIRNRFSSLLSNLMPFDINKYLPEDASALPSNINDVELEKNAQETISKTDFLLAQETPRYLTCALETNSVEVPVINQNLLPIDIKIPVKVLDFIEGEIELGAEMNSRNLLIKRSDIEDDKNDGDIDIDDECSVDE